MKDSVIIVSGGMDSITLLYDKKDEIALGISFNYGSNHNEREIPFAKMHCERLGIKHITIDLGFMHQYFKSFLLEGADAIPEGHYAADNMKSTVVPFRNGIMLSIAIGTFKKRTLEILMHETQIYRNMLDSQTLTMHLGERNFTLVMITSIVKTNAECNLVFLIVEQRDAIHAAAHNDY
jgi:hypothetical protein